MIRSSCSGYWVDLDVQTDRLLASQLHDLVGIHLDYLALVHWNSVDPERSEDYGHGMELGSSGSQNSEICRGTEAERPARFYYCKASCESLTF